MYILHVFFCVTTTPFSLYFLPSPVIPLSFSFSPVLATPKLVQLKLLRTPGGVKIEIIKTIAAKWKEVGDFLDFDSTGAALDVIQANHMGRGGVMLLGYVPVLTGGEWERPCLAGNCS